MKLTFDAKLVRKLMEHARAATDHRLSYGQAKKEPGLLLVGDNGVYLMSNGIPALSDPDRRKGSLVAYANECNPLTMDFDAWWETKRRSFGGDDGVEFLALSDLPKSGDIAIEMAPDSFVLFEVVGTV